MIYVKRYKAYPTVVGFFRHKGKPVKGWCADWDYDKWSRIFGIKLEVGQHKKIEFREVEE